MVKAADLSMVWYIESGGAIWDENAPSLRAGRADETYHPTGNHELWLLDRGEILARASEGMLACALLRRQLPTA